MPGRQVWGARDCGKASSDRDDAPDDQSHSLLTYAGARAQAEEKKLTIVGVTSAAAPDEAQLGALFVKGATAVHVVLSRLDADDALLRARVALSLGHALHERACATLLPAWAAEDRADAANVAAPATTRAARAAAAPKATGAEAGELRRAVQVLSTAITAVEGARADAVAPGLHAPAEADDHVFLARQAVTTEVDSGVY